MIEPCAQKWVHSLIALQPPKTGSTSLNSCLGERNLVEKHRGLFAEKYQNHPLYRGVFNTRHCIPSHVFSIFGRACSDYLSIVTIRHPLERLISSYSFGQDNKLWKVYGLSPKISFSGYIDWLYENRKRNDILILLPQTVWANNDYFSPEILRLENIDEDWPNLLKKYKIAKLPERLPQENRSNHLPWQEVFRGETLKKALDIVQSEFTLFPELEKLT